ncbi:unnamed protein product [Closterium sp. Naga37s-1]|nr:unnamed protein product [Closterium sp. Naga37s-1]
MRISLMRCAEPFLSSSFLSSPVGISALSPTCMTTRLLLSTQPPTNPYLLLFQPPQPNRYNLLWIERNRLAPLKVKQLEMLMGYPEGHVSVVTNNKTSRYKMLGNTFHVPTVALHLSVLRRLNRPIRVLSLFSGISGALVALHMEAPFLNSHYPFPFPIPITHSPSPFPLPIPLPHSHYPFPFPIPITHSPSPFPAPQSLFPISLLPIPIPPSPHLTGNTFHVPTVALHLSVLRRLNRPIRVLSLFSGIGGALVALHMVKVPVICAVSVEFEKSCRDAEGRWWRETAMAEERAGRDGVNQMLGELLQLYHNPSAVLRSSVTDGASHAATAAAAAVIPAASAPPIKYHGGPVIVGNPTVNVYHIYYGSWGSGSGKEVIDAFVQALSSDSGSQGSAADASVKGWWAISTAYYQSGSGGKKNVSSKVRLAGTVSDNYSRGKKLTDEDVIAIVKSKVGAGKPFALDPHGIYVLLTSSDVTLKGYCTEYCGWHTEDSINSSPLRYAFVGHRGQCPDSCGVESTSPNGKPGIDATISTLAHELTEAATDPDANAGWFDDGEENADKCSWEYGTTKTGYQQSGQSYKYNVVGLNGMKFLVQLNWDRVKSKCVLQSALPSAGGGGVGTPPPPPPTGGSVKMRCDCNCASASNPMSCQCSCTKTG